MSTVIAYDDDKLLISGADTTESACNKLQEIKGEPAMKERSLVDDLCYLVNVVKQSHLGGEGSRLSLAQILFGPGRPNSTVWENDETPKSPALNERYGSALDDIETVYHLDEAAIGKACKIIKRGAVCLAIATIVYAGYRLFKK